MSTTHVLFPSESTANPNDEIYFVTLSLYYRNLPSICIVYYSTNSGLIFRNYTNTGHQISPTFKYWFKEKGKDKYFEV